MRPWLRWTLIASVLLSLVALVWWPAEPAPTVAAATSAASPMTDPNAPPAWGTAPQATPGPVTLSPGRGAAIATAAASGPLPAQLARAELEPAVAHDPFVGQAPPPPPQAQTKPVEPPPPPPPMAPTLSYRFLGRFVGPDGKTLVYLTRPDGRDLPVGVGTRLDEGYVVEAITAEAVKLHYPPLDQRTSIPIPPAER